MSSTLVLLLACLAPLACLAQDCPVTHNNGSDGHCYRDTDFQSQVYFTGKAVDANNPSIKTEFGDFNVDYLPPAVPTEPRL